MITENTCSIADPTAIRVLVVDDHAVVRQGLRALLETEPGIRVIGEAENGRRAVTETMRLQPDIVLLDLSMPLLNGVEAARQIAREVPTAKVLVLSAYSDDEHLRQAIEAGAAGYLMKESGGEDLVGTVRRTHNGEAAFNSPLLRFLLNTRRKEVSGGQRVTGGKAKVTERETEVLQLIAEGYATKQIAAVLFIAPKTVQKHRQSVMNKLGLHNIARLTRYAVSTGLVDSNRGPDLLVSPSRSRPKAKGKKALIMRSGGIGEASPGELGHSPNARAPLY